MEPSVVQTVPQEIPEAFRKNYSLGKRRKSILIIPYGHALAHVTRPLEIAKELKEDGCDIIFAGTGAHLNLAEREGFKVIKIAELDHDRILNAIRENKLTFASQGELEYLINEEIRLYEQLKPDLVVSDCRVTASTSTEICQIMHCGIVNAYMTKYRSIPFFSPRQIIPKKIVANKIINRLMVGLERFVCGIECRIFDLVMRDLHKARLRYDLKRHISSYQFFEGNDFTLLPDIPEYAPTRNLPCNFYYIGPLTWRNSLAPPECFNLLKKDKKVVYVTIGSSGFADVFDKIITLKDFDIQIVASTGGKKLPHVYSKTYPDIFIEPFVNGDLMMKKSDLVICHGGNGTVYQALRNGVPIIGMASHQEQDYNLKRIESLGIGKRLKHGDVKKDPSLLVRAVHEVLSEPKYRKNASIYEQILSNYNGAKSGARIIENYMNTLKEL